MGAGQWVLHQHMRAGKAQNAKEWKTRDYFYDEMSIITYFALLTTVRPPLKPTRAVLNVDNLRVYHEGLHQPSYFDYE